MRAFAWGMNNRSPGALSAKLRRLAGSLLCPLDVDPRRSIGGGERLLRVEAGATEIPSCFLVDFGGELDQLERNAAAPLSCFVMGAAGFSSVPSSPSRKPRHFGGFLFFQTSSS